MLRTGQIVKAATVFALAITSVPFAIPPAGAKSPSREDRPQVIRGQNSWASVAGSAPRGFALHYRDQRGFTAGWLSFPEGRMPSRSRRDYVGITIVRIKVRPASEVPSGIDYVQAQVGGWGYSMIEVQRKRKRGCPNEVTWVSSGMISGTRRGTSCDGTITLKESNLLTYGSVRPGPKRWFFNLDSLGRPLVESAWISPRSRVGITQVLTSDLRLYAPKTFELPDGEDGTVKVGIRNLGSRAARDLKVQSWVEQDGFPIVSSLREKRLRPLATGGSRKTRITVAGLPDGEYILFLSVSDRDSGDLLMYRLVVGEESLRSARPRGAAGGTAWFRDGPDPRGSSPGFPAR